MGCPTWVFCHSHAEGLQGECAAVSEQILIQLQWK